LAAVACATVLAVLAPAGATAGPVYEPKERALATATPSLAYVEIIFRAYLREIAADKLVVEQQLTYSRRCSGIVVSPGGPLLSASACVQVQEKQLLQIMLEQVARGLVAAKKLTTPEVTGYVNDRLKTTRLTGKAVGTQPDVKAFVQLNYATAGAEAGPAMPAKIAKVVSAGPSPIAVVQVTAGARMPAIEFAPESSRVTGVQLLILGFGTSDAAPGTARFAPSSKLVKITGTGSKDGATWLRLDGDLGAVSSGGMALDMSGRLVGMLQPDIEIAARPIRAATVVADLSKALTEAGDGAGNKLDEADQTYRSALDAYFRGRYEEAVAGFDRVIVAAPLNETARAYRQQALDWQAIEGDAGSNSVWLVALLAGLAGAAAAFGLTFAVILVRQVRRRRAGAVATAHAGGGRVRYALPGHAADEAQPGLGPIIEGESEHRRMVEGRHDAAAPADDHRS
jgi:hypothetical protein